jgi:hypothetical protein
VILRIQEPVVVTESSSTYFANDGAAYERFLGRWSRRLADHLIAFANFAATGDLLDVGRGTGGLAIAWPERRIVGIDAAKDTSRSPEAEPSGRLRSLISVMQSICRIPIIPSQEVARNWS